MEHRHFTYQRQKASLFETLADICDWVSCLQIPIFLDGGIRRGTDVFKALGLGCSVRLTWLGNRGGLFWSQFVPKWGNGWQICNIYIYMYIYIYIYISITACGHVGMSACDFISTLPNAPGAGWELTPGCWLVGSLGRLICFGRIPRDTRR